MSRRPCVRRPRPAVPSIALPLLVAVTTLALAAPGQTPYPETPRIPVTDDLHGTLLTDDYRWLEDGSDPPVVEWEAEQVAYTRALLDPLPQRAYLVERFTQLWRYDDEKAPTQVIDGERLFFHARRKEDEKWTYMTRASADAPAVEILNPNTWEEAKTLASAAPSRDGSLLAYGIAQGGDENPVIQIMEVESGRVLPDRLRGWKQEVTAWLPDHSGFYYCAKPLAGEVPEGEEYYWHTAYLHRLGTPAEQDEVVFNHDSVKEYWHEVTISEDGRYEIYERSLFNKNEIYFRPVGDDGPLTPLVTGFDARYHALMIGDTILIRTDADAPLEQVLVTSTDRPEREHWRPFIPEHERDKLAGLSGVAGHLFVTYQHNAYTQIKMFDLDGTFIRDVPLPTIGTGSVSGHWSQPTIWVRFSSFTYPSTTFRYDLQTDRLAVYRTYPIDVDVDRFTAEQVWYQSKDGTPVSMFLVHRRDMERNGRIPTLLTGYGGFNISRRPYFSTTMLVWCENGGLVAMPNLRGGGEYGRDWHEAGMLERKQNVFDDFIAAAEWLIDSGYTSSERLAISGGSNGGLLVGAAAMQRPDLFRSVNCAVPLLDMIRYHRLGLANIWAEEYGSADDPTQFPYLLRYSPYQNVVDGTDYPAMLITAGENDARVDPAHARKMVARLQAANPDGEPTLLLMRRDTGHGSGTTLSIKIQQAADQYAYLMSTVGMEVQGTRGP